MNPRRDGKTLAIGAALACVVVCARPALACTCVTGEDGNPWPTLDQAAMDADAVVIARVLSQKKLTDPSPYEGRDVAYIDVVIIDGIKTLKPSAHLRVWDGGFGTSCTGDLRPLLPGTLIAVALARNRPALREYHEMMRLNVAPEDYIVGTCGEYMQILKSRGEAHETAARLRAAVRAGLKGRRTTR